MLVPRPDTIMLLPEILFYAHCGAIMFEVAWLKSRKDAVRVIFACNGLHPGIVCGAIPSNNMLKLPSIVHVNETVVNALGSAELLEVLNCLMDYRPYHLRTAFIFPCVFRI